jgi:hypothetical protein
MAPTGAFRRIGKTGIMLVINMKIIAINVNTVGVIESPLGRGEVISRTQRRRVGHSFTPYLFTSYGRWLCFK